MEKTYVWAAILSNRGRNKKVTNKPKHTHIHEEKKQANFLKYILYFWLDFSFLLMKNKLYRVSFS